MMRHPLFLLLRLTMFCITQTQTKPEPKLYFTNYNSWSEQAKHARLFTTKDEAYEAYGAIRCNPYGWNRANPLSIEHARRNITNV